MMRRQKRSIDSPRYTLYKTWKWKSFHLKKKYPLANKQRKVGYPNSSKWKEQNTLLLWESAYFTYAFNLDLCFNEVNTMK